MSNFIAVALYERRTYNTAITGKVVVSDDVVLYSDVMLY